MTDLYAVIGNPISHTKSPLIHRMFAEATGQDLAYVAIEGPPGGFAGRVDQFRREGGRGLNVTAPFKLDAFAYATDVSAGRAPRRRGQRHEIRRRARRGREFRRRRADERHRAQSRLSARGQTHPAPGSRRSDAGRDPSVPRPRDLRRSRSPIERPTRRARWRRSSPPTARSWAWDMTTSPACRRSISSSMRPRRASPANCRPFPRRVSRLGASATNWPTGRG